MSEVPRYARRFFDPAQRLFRIGEGALGGKALGLLRAQRVLAARAPAPSGEALTVDVPSLVVLASDFFETFVERNGLAELAASGESDQAIASAFHRAPVPAEMVGDLRALAEEVRVPLAVRSSSVLEDALGRPFAGVYGTKMVPGDQPDAEARFRSLLDAVKFVWASTCFAGARAYLEASARSAERESMAVLVQEVVGYRHGERFYPEISGVARSFNFYPVGAARPEDGVLDLALGLGKTIVDGGLCWTVSPSQPRVGPPFASARELVEATQTEFWSIRVGTPPPYDPMSEVEFLVRRGLSEAESDGALRLTASTFDPASERLWPGLGRQGPRVLDFAPILVHEELPLVATVRDLLAACAEEVGAPVEIEFALSLPPRAPARFGLLQVRPLFVSSDVIDVAEGALADPRALIVSRAALGNGRRLLEDVVFVDPERFEARATPAIALELERLNRALVAAHRPYLLIGFGRWGSSDPWLGIPVRWDQISGARAIVEATLPGMSPEPSQGSHFFHNLSSFAALYLTVPPGDERGIDWRFLAGQPRVGETEHVRHVRCAHALRVEVDGRTRRGGVWSVEEP
jgi:hypothetical protein